jgi:predicted transcriptional regulator
MSDVVDDLVAMIIHSGLTNYALASRAGVHWSTIDAWVNGKHRPTIVAMNKVLHVLNQELAIRQEKVQKAYQPKKTNNVRMAVWMRQP